MFLVQLVPLCYFCFLLEVYCATNIHLCFLLFLASVHWIHFKHICALIWPPARGNSQEEEKVIPGLCCVSASRDTDTVHDSLAHLPVHVDCTSWFPTHVYKYYSYIYIYIYRKCFCQWWRCVLIPGVFSSQEALFFWEGQTQKVCNLLNRKLQSLFECRGVATLL